MYNYRLGKLCITINNYNYFMYSHTDHTAVGIEDIILCRFSSLILYNIFIIYSSLLSYTL